MPSEGSFRSQWSLGHGELHMPDRVIWALLGVAVLSEANHRETTTGDYYLSLGEERFPIREWWGRESDFRPIADRYNKVRVKLDRLEQLMPPREGKPEQVEILRVINPPFLPPESESTP